MFNSVIKAFLLLVIISTTTFQSLSAEWPTLEPGSKKKNESKPKEENREQPTENKKLSECELFCFSVFRACAGEEQFPLPLEISYIDDICRPLGVACRELACNGHITDLSVISIPLIIEESIKEYEDKHRIDIVSYEQPQSSPAMGMDITYMNN